MQSNEAFIREWLAERSGVEAESIDPALNMFEAGYINSLGTFAMVTDLEDEFGITFSQDDLVDPRLSTVNGLLELVAEKG